MSSIRSYFYHKKIRLLKLFFLFLISIASPSYADENFTCNGGALEAKIWDLWDKKGIYYFRNLLHSRLIKKGDTYALYDIQILFQNLVSMAQRCGQIGRSTQFANELTVAFSALETLESVSEYCTGNHLCDKTSNSTKQISALPNGNIPKAWICKGGSVCNTNNRLVNKEVVLVSVQGLGLISFIANTLATSDNEAVFNHPFVKTATSTSINHLLRWAASDKERLQKLFYAKPLDVKNGSSALFFTDHSLWKIAIYAELAGIYAVNVDLYNELKQSDKQYKVAINAFRILLQLFNARTSYHILDKPISNQFKRADLDAGFWRLYGNNRYAGYTADKKPATCITTIKNTKAQINIPSKDLPIIHDLGWDFSHARRFVQAVDALERNRVAIKKVFKLKDTDLPDKQLGKALAAQLIMKVWNGDRQEPKFANYWNGANGWYRVAYDNGTGYCYEGYPPFGLSNAFATGGYATWVKYEPTIGKISRRIYNLSIDRKEGSQHYIDNYLSNLSRKSPPTNRMLGQLMFWPSLIHKNIP